jgi:hypothetical protein
MEAVTLAEGLKSAHSLRAPEIAQLRKNLHLLTRPPGI